MASNSKEIEPLSLNLVMYIVLNFTMIWVSLFPSALVGYWFFLTFPFSFNPLYLLLLIPLFFALYGITLISSMISIKIGIWLVHKRIASPKLGTFRLSMDEPQIRAFVLKGNIKNFGRWLYNFFHLKFLYAFWLRRMGVKIGKNVRLSKFVTDEENLEYGDNVFCGWETIFASHLMYQDAVMFTKTKIGNNCIFEGHGGAVGATIGDNSIIQSITGIMNGQICRGNAIYQGIPAKKVADNDLTPEEIKELKRKIRKYDKINWIKRKNAPIKTNETKMFLMKLLIVLAGCLFALIFPYLYSLLFLGFYSPTNHLLNIALLTLIPFIFLFAISFFIVGIAIITKIFIAYYDRKAEIPEGYYELDDPRAKWFKIKYFLRLFGLRLFHGTPFRVADSLAMRFWGKVKFGKNVWMDTAIVDPQYLEVGDYSHLGQSARIHTHDIINDKLYIKTVKIGKNVLLGGYVHIKPGVEIADGSICAVGAWFRKNRKCKRRALWIGKPAFELPVEFFARATSGKQNYID